MEIIDKERIRTINPNNTDYCFSAFLYAISTIAGEEGYKLYAIVMKLLRECINAHLLD